jgi:hypothetical protein
VSSESVRQVLDMVAVGIVLDQGTAVLTGPAKVEHESDMEMIALLASQLRLALDVVEAAKYTLERLETSWHLHFDELRSALDAFEAAP